MNDKQSKEYSGWTTTVHPLSSNTEIGGCITLTHSRLLKQMELETMLLSGEVMA